MEKVLAFTRFERVTQNQGNTYVESELDKGEHHSTNRASARKFLRETLGIDWEIGSYLGPVFYRRSDGYSARANRYSAVRITN